MGTDIKIEKVEKENKKWFVYFRLDGKVQVGLTDNGFLTVFKESCKQDILDKVPCVIVRHPLKRIGDTDETLVGRKKIKIRKKHQGMVDHRSLQDDGEKRPIIVRPKKEIGRIKRLEKSRAVVHKENTAQIITFHQVSTIVPSPLTLQQDYVSEEMIYRPIPSNEDTYNKPYKCLKCREVMKRRKRAGWCKKCTEILDRS